MVSGAIIGGLVATEGLVPYFFERVFGISGDWTLLLGGLLLIVTLIQNPDGVSGTTYRKWQLKKKAAALRADADRTEPSRVPAHASAMVAEP
jgi:branched-chain amino acid transport system permease protein